MARLGDLCRFINGDRGKNYPSQAEISSTGDVPFINAGHIVGGKLDFSDMNYISEEKYNQLNSGKIQENDVLYCLRGSLGKKAIIKGIPKGAIASSLVIIRPDSRLINSDYLFYALESPTVQEQMMQANNGSSQPNLSAKSVSDYAFNLPTINEQCEIVSKLAKVSEVIALRKEQLAKLDQLVKSRFIELFGEVETNVKGFPMKRMDECCKFIGGAQPDKSHFEYEKTDDNIRLIQIRDYKSDRFITYIPKSLARKTCTASDIMIGRYGPPIFQILGGIEGAYNVALMKAVPTAEFNTEYFRYFLKSEKLLHYLESFSQRTAGQDGIQIDKLNAYSCFVPPMELQILFAAFVEQTDKSKLAVQKSLEKLELLKKALMQKYFG